MPSPLTVQEILQANLPFSLQLVSAADLEKQIQVVDLNRPGLALAGFFDKFAHDRIQVFGKGEWSYVNSLSASESQERLQTFFSFQIPCLVFTHGNTPQDSVLQAAAQKQVAVLTTKASSHIFTEVFADYLDARLAKKFNIHGVLLDVFGIGVLLMGKSGIGKSETALELVERGHRLISDDVVLASCRKENKIYGEATEENEHHMEIRGLGIINIKELFGAGSVRKKIEIDLLIYLEKWQEEHEYDRLGIDESYTELLGVKVPSLTLPILPGRNIPILIETAAKNHRLKLMGKNAAKEFAKKLQERITKQKTIENMDDSQEQKNKH